MNQNNDNEICKNCNKQLKIAEYIDFDGYCIDCYHLIVINNYFEDYDKEQLSR